MLALVAGGDAAATLTALEDDDGGGMGHDTSEGEKMPLLATLTPLVWESWLERRETPLWLLWVAGRSREGEKSPLLPAEAVLRRESWLVRR